MASLTLVHPEETFTIPALQAMNKCSLFQNNPTLRISPYRVQSPVSLSIFREFISALEANAINITDTNFTELNRLCGEFGFTELAAKLSEFRPSMDFKEAEDADARGRIAALEEEANQHDYNIEMLHLEVKKLSQDFGRLTHEVAALRSAMGRTQTASGNVSAPETQIAVGLGVQFVQQLSMELSELREEVSALWKFPAAPRFDSQIISAFPEIFAEFRGKRFSLLWRGSRDGFSASEFHRRCDVHGNTLTVILDTEGNIFGGFTPVEWESRVWNKIDKDGDNDNTLKADNSLKSFLFTLKNPSNLPAKRFKLRAEMKHRAILCNSARGPWFYDIGVSSDCNTNTRSWNCLGSTYTNDTGLEGRRVFTNSQNFQGREVEVFQIID
jgi:hypothetical protein